MIRRAAPALLLGVALSGCIATQQDVREVEQQADELKVQVTELKKTLNQLQENQADLSVKVDQVHSDLATFNETMKDSGDRMDKLSGKMDDLQAALAQKVTALGDTLSKNQAATQAAAQAAITAAEKAQQKAEEAETIALSPTQLFRSAKSNLLQKNYDLAAQGFETYLKRYPKGATADWATYYLGEAYFGKKDWENAARQYALVLDRWPKSQATAASRLKYAICLINMKKNLSEARKYLESIPDDFPKSPEVRQARKLLKSLPATK